MESTRRWVGLAVAVAVLAPGSARAWGNRGHEIVAMIAYQDLADSPGTQKKLHDLLKSHPQYDDYLAKNPPAGVPLDEWVVRRAATWPDAARDDPAYHRPTWHYVNKPFLLDPTPAASLLAAVEKKFASTKENHGDLLIAYPDCRRVVRERAGPKPAQAVRVCWVFHLAGDAHQPLHAVTLCTKQLPGGDRGGNLTWVRRKPGLFPTSLHSYWDHLPDAEAKNPAEAAKVIRMETDFTAKERQVGEVGAWADEGYELARTKAYRFNGAPIRFALDTDGGDPPSDVPVVADDFEGYQMQAERVARKRMLLAGLRLADALRTDLGN